ncbi:4-hydroxybenzoate polyprenyltransferase [Acetanaerobacterium elongatum]|uniref:4-hydroxybenzoate polyprenyltransferase n=2 Tax=Acetanaerobacterium elongatum TaxID=258515 RepID=A0A1G9XWY1_9FIRM|nr:4-hydroxybenzoate polyprenyltransferase [Acetanaerobacterium elongatum]
MRIKHYVKNGLIFLPLIFSGQFFYTNLLVKVMEGILCFSFLSSAIYIFNDIKDVDHDRCHPIKKARPIASGEVSVFSASLIACILLALSVIFNCLAFGAGWRSWFILILYLLLNVGYSLGLKNIPIVDVAILVLGFLLRVLYGSVITNIEISKWLYLTVISSSFYLALGKRRNELSRVSASGTTRKVLQLYNYGFLDKNMYICLALTITFYSLWSVDLLTIQKANSENLIWTVPLIILICMKYSLSVENNSDGDPVEVIWGDKILLSIVAVFCLVVFGIIYF